MKSSNVQLLGVKEQLKENLSSNQIANTLDDLMFKFLEHVILSTNYLEYVLVELIIHIFTNARRKFSNVPVGELQDSLFSIIVCEDKESKIKLLRELRIERTIYFEMLNNFEAFAKEYIEEVSKSLRDNQVSQRINEIETQAKSVNSNFYSVCTGTLFWSKRIYAFRNMIVEKYIRLARVEANKAAAGTGLQVSKDDLTRSLILSIFKAINKYDPQKGTLTSYIKWWFVDAKNNQNHHEEGVAYTIPSQSRALLLKQGVVNIYEPIDQNTESTANEEDIAQTMEREEEHILISNLACRVDQNKVFVLLSNLRYTPTVEDIEQLRSTME